MNDEGYTNHLKKRVAQLEAEVKRLEKALAEERGKSSQREVEARIMGNIEASRD